MWRTFMTGIRTLAPSSRLSKETLAIPIAVLLAGPVYAMIIVLNMFYIYGPLICITFSTWRLWERDYHISGSADASLTNLTPALIFFYTLALCHGVLYYFLLVLVVSQFDDIVLFRKQCKFPKEWGMIAVREYLQNSREEFAGGRGIVEGRSLIGYAVGLLGSESQEDYLSGAQIVDRLINDGEREDASSIILGSRPKMQRLLGTLGRRRSSTSSSTELESEIRLLAARIVADLADGIQLAQFPGAIQSVSSLLETTGQPCRKDNRRRPSPAERRYQEKILRRFERIDKILELPFQIVKKLITSVIPRKKPESGALGQGDGDHGVQQKIEVSSAGDGRGVCNELILQGFRILERLACDDRHNCMDICGDPGLIAKITTALYSDTLIEDIGSSEPWDNVANASLKVVYRLIHVAPGKRLRQEISSNKLALSNLESMLDLSGKKQLQMRAIEILTELVLDSSLNITEKTRDNLVRKQLEIFLADEGDEEQVPVPDTMPIRMKTRTIKATAGESLSILSKSEPISEIIVKEHDDIVDRLTGMLDADCNTRYRTLSAEILENLCTLYMEQVNELLIRKVLAEILTIKTKPETKEHSDDGSRDISSVDDDEEMQRPRHDDQNANDNAFDHRANDDEAEMKQLQEALLSLTLVIHDKLIGVESFALVIQEKSPGGEGAFLDKLKAIVDDNCEEMTPVSLRIFKLCGQIAASIMRSNLCTNDQKKEFVESLSKASKTIAKLESCVLFAGNDYGGLHEAARPLLYHLDKELKGLVA
uniref:Uncharacterized protein n=1 Tax=Oryza punctata TaxID=4537 RepID=A0A0E0MDI3_ORYPU